MADSHTKVSEQLELWNNLNGKVVLITGASSGFGWDLSIDLAKAGCKVIAAARRLDRINSLCNIINANASSVTPPAVALELDITADSPVIESAVQKAWTAFGHIDVLVNNAGVRGSTSSAMKLTKEEWDNVFKTNLEGSWLCAKYVGLRMQEAGKGGSIMNITSTFGLNRVQSTGSLAYSSSKAGMHAMTTVMALEFGQYNIRVNAIAPTIFPSEITRQFFKQKRYVATIGKMVALPMVESVVHPGMTSLVRYLIHDSSKYVTGNIYIVDLGNSLAGVPLWSSL